MPDRLRIDAAPNLLRVGLALWGMARPLIMVSVVLVYGFGLIMARAQGYSAAAPAIAWGLAALALVSTSIHYINEYVDFPTDSLTRRTQFSGGSGVLPRGLVPPHTALRAAWTTLALGLAVGLAGVLAGALDVWALGLLGLGALGGWQYSSRPFRLAWRGWGELANAVLGGLVLTAYGYAVAARGLDGVLLLAALPFTLAVFLNLLATTWADRAADAAVGKRTLATRLPAGKLRALYGVIALVFVSLLGWLPLTAMIASLAALPLIGWGWLHYTRTDSPALSVWAMVVLLLAQMAGFWAAG